MKRSTVHKALERFTRVRFRMARFIYDQICVFLIRDESWQERFFVSLIPRAGDRILILGAHSSSLALAFALRYPAATFHALDTDSKSIAKARRRVAKKQLRNFIAVIPPDKDMLAFHARSFDKAVCMLGLQDRPPDAKLALAREISRILRRGGTLHVVDFDKPENRSEGGILEFARRISGAAAVAPHLNGSWLECLAKSGFAGVHRKSSYSIGIGRLSVVKARKR